MNVYALIVLTALISSLLTAGVAVLAIRLWWKHRLREAMETKLDEAGELIREQVRAGVVEGVSESVNNLPNEVVRSTTRTMTQTGMDIVEEGLSTILGKPKRRR